LVTADYVIDELLTLIRARADHRSAVKIGAAIFRGELAHVEWVSVSDVTEAWNTFRSFDDKRWSFTDCVSRVIIERMGIPYAFAFDEHFRQFGNVIVIP
jgi:predicted nucleic acid-binding protein